MRSFLQAVSTVTEEAPTPLRVVQMEGLVIASETHNHLLFALAIWHLTCRDLRNLGVLRVWICLRSVSCCGDRNQGKVTLSF